MKKSTVYFAVLLILVIAIAVLSFLIIQRRPPAEPEPSAVPTVNPPVEESDPVITPDPSSAPKETPEPTEPPVFETRPPVETEEPKPEETPEPVPADASGSFRSDTGTGLNLKADWKTYTDAGGSRKLQVDVSTLSYSFYTSALYQSIVLTVDGKDYAANSVEVSYDGKDLTETPMASFTVDAPAAGSPVSVVWHYRGTYSGKELNDITAAGVIG